MDIDGPRDIQNIEKFLSLFLNVSNISGFFLMLFLLKSFSLLLRSIVVNSKYCLF